MVDFISRTHCYKLKFLIHLNYFNLLFLFWIACKYILHSHIINVHKLWKPHEIPSTGDWDINYVTIAYFIVFLRLFKKGKTQDFLFNCKVLLRLFWFFKKSVTGLSCLDLPLYYYLVWWTEIPLTINNFNFYQFNFFPIFCRLNPLFKRFDIAEFIGPVYYFLTSLIQILGIVSSMVLTPSINTTLAHNTWFIFQSLLIPAKK